MLSKRYDFPCPPLSPYEDEVLTVLIEECAEVQRAASKLKRFGKGNFDPKTGVANTAHLAAEIGDVMELIALCESIGLIDMNDVHNSMRIKRDKLKMYMRYVPLKE